MESGPYALNPSPVTVRDVASVVWRRLWVILLIVAAALGTAAYVSLRTPERWRAEAQIILVQRVAPVLDQQNRGGGRSTEETVATQVAMLRSYGMTIRTLNYLRNQAIAGEITESVLRGLDPETLRKDMEVSAQEGTDIVDVKVAAGSRATAETLTNAVCAAFVDWKKEVSQQGAAETVGTLEERVQKARARLVEAEQKEMDFRKGRRLVDVPAQSTAAVQEYIERDAEAVRAQEEVAVQQAKVRELAQRLKAANVAIEQGTGVRDDSLVLGLQQQLTSLEIERANAALKFRPDYPGPGNLAEIDSRIKDIRQRLARALQSTLDNKRPSLEGQASMAQQYNAADIELRFARAKLAAALAARNMARGKTASLPDTTLEHARLTREVELAKSLYTSLQASLNAARLDKDSASGNVQIAQYAFVPDKPYEPNHARNILLGLAVGLALAFTAVLLLEQADTRVRTVEDIRELVPGPVVGALPRWSSGEVRAIMAGDTPALAQEAYSLARVNLSIALRQALNGSGENPQVILVTSAMPGEGKSMTAAQMARSMARSGSTVILVDADMRRPTQNALFGTDEPVGLADVLSGKMSLQDALVASDTDNLSILHSGHPDRNPTDMLSLPVLADVINALRAESETVIIDAPACSVVADALILAPYVDCILHVVSAGHADAAAVRQATEALAAVGAKATVFFVNRAPRGSGYYHSYYYYGNGHQPKARPALSATEEDDVAVEKGDLL